MLGVKKANCTGKSKFLNTALRDLPIQQILTTQILAYAP